MNAILDAWPVLAGIAAVLLVVGRSQHQLSDLVRRVERLEVSSADTARLVARLEERTRV